MARTPLLRSIRKLFSDFRAAQQRGVGVDSVRESRAAQAERAGQRGLTRRQLFMGAGAAAGLLALPRQARAAPKGGPVVAIVGGGIAGVTCALKLADRNIAATVYEASGRIGGRMFSNSGGYWDAGQVSEWCGELIDTQHTLIEHLAKRFGLPLDDLYSSQPTGSTETYQFGGHYYSKAQADADFQAVFAAVDADQTAAPFPTTFDASTAAGRVLSNMSVYDWIESRVPGGHRSPMGQLLDAAYNIEYGAETTDQSALNLVYLLAFQPDPTQLVLFGESDERYHIRGGNQRLPEAIAASLGSAIQTGYSMTKLKQTAAGRYLISFDHAGGSTDVTADFVVLALPFAVLRGLDYAQAGFDALKNTAIQQLGRAHNGKTQMQFAKRLWNQTGPWGLSNGTSYSDTGYQAGWEVSRAQPGTQGLMVLYSGGNVTDAMKASGAFGTIGAAGIKSDVQTGLARVEPVFPGLSKLWNGKASQSLPHKSPFFNCSYSYYRLGQYTQFSGYEGVTQGGVYFCGEHTSQDFQGFMEGGAEEGKRAARQLAKAMTGSDNAAADAL